MVIAIRPASRPRVRSPRAAHRREGFTLFELLLVLVIVLILGGLTFSNVQGLYEKKLLQDAGQAVRTDLAAGRLLAIDTGAVYLFQYEPEGTAYALTSIVTEANPNVVLPSRERQLPATMRFVSRTSRPASTLGAGGESAQGSAGLVSLVLFLPDGSASDAVVDVADAAGRSLSISVRGLTAAATVSGVRFGSTP